MLHRTKVMGMLGEASLQIASPYQGSSLHPGMRIHLATEDGIVKQVDGDAVLVWVVPSYEGKKIGFLEMATTPPSASYSQWQRFAFQVARCRTTAGFDQANWNIITRKLQEYSPHLRLQIIAGLGTGKCGTAIFYMMDEVSAMVVEQVALLAGCEGLGHPKREECQMVQFRMPFDVWTRSLEEQLPFAMLPETATNQDVDLCLSFDYWNHSCEKNWAMAIQVSRPAMPHEIASLYWAMRDAGQGLLCVDAVPPSVHQARRKSSHIY